MATTNASGDVLGDLGARRRAGRRPAWRLLLAHVSPYRWPLLGGGLLGLLGGGAALAQPMVAKLVIDTLGQRRSPVGPAALLTGLAVAGALLGTAGMYLLGRAAEGVVLTARQRLISRLLRLRVSTLDRVQPGDLLARVTSDTTLLRSVSTYGLVHAVNAVLVLVTAVVLMALLDQLLLLVTVAVLAVNVLAVLFVVPRIRQATERSQAAVGQIGSVLERALGALRTVKATGAEDRQIAAIDLAAGQAWRRGLEVARWTALMESSTALAVQVSFLAVLGLGGIRVAAGALPVSSLIAFLLYLVLLTDPISSLVNAATQLQVGLAAAARIGAVDELPAERPARPAAGPGWSSPRLGPATVEFSGVWFSYRPPGDGAWVHRDLSFQVPAGGTTAIVGSSGAGKSTVFALLERYYEPQAGGVRVDGRDVREWPLPELRAAIGYVEQDAPVVAGTLRENICLAAPNADERDLRAVLAMTRLDKLLERLPEGLETTVGQRGTTLSGGEQQRIAIARAVLRRPRILLLDEATSQLDAVNELALRELMEVVARTTTVLVIAHRLSTVRGVDRIFVMDAGGIRAGGTHEELLAGDELYRRLATTQLLGAA